MSEMACTTPGSPNGSDATEMPCLTEMHRLVLELSGPTTKLAI